MSAIPTYRALLAQAASALAADDDPDSPAHRQALLLAAHAGVHHAGGEGGADWDLYTVAVTQAVQDLQAEMDESVVLFPEVPAPGPDSVQLRRAVIGLVSRLADRYATAAAGQRGSPWRRLVWAKVAHQLDDAVGELR